MWNFEQSKNHSWNFEGLDSNYANLQTTRQSKTRIRKRWWKKIRRHFLPRDFVRPHRRRLNLASWLSSGPRSYGWDRWHSIGPTTKSRTKWIHPFFYIMTFRQFIALHSTFRYPFKSLHSSIRIKTYDLQLTFSSGINLLKPQMRYYGCSYLNQVVNAIEYYKSSPDISRCYQR